MAITRTALVRLQEARSSLRHCEFCERRCGVDRLHGEQGFCGLGYDTMCFKKHISYAEEVHLLPSLRLYFAGCNLRCQFCLQAPACFKDQGPAVDPLPFALNLADQVSRGVKSLSLMGGEPTLHAHTILEIAASSPRPLPLVINSNMYTTPLVLDLLQDVAELYLADFKFGNNQCGHTVAGVDNYFDTAARNLLYLKGRTKLMVRHLLLPGHIDCCFKPIAAWMSSHLDGIDFKVMLSYLPSWRSGEDRDLTRRPSHDEIAEVEECLRILGIGENASARIRQ